MNVLNELYALRDEGGAKLSAIAAEWGDGSEFFRRCVELWRRHITDAFVSLSHRDVASARAQLERGLYVLTLGPEALKRQELTVEDVVRLMDSV